MKESVIKGLVTRLNKRLAALQPGELLVKKNLHAEVYHRADGISNSRLKVFLDCPAKYRALFITGEAEPKQSAAFDLGKAAHCLVLEPEKFAGEFVLQPAEIKTRRGKAWDAFVAENPDKVVLTADQWEACHKIRDSVARHAFGRRLLAGGQAEVSYFKRDEETGLIIKCRADYVLGDLLVDVKTALSAAPDAFTRKALDLGYHLQDAIYRDVTGLPEFAFVAVEKEAPFVVTAPLLFSAEARQLGYLKYRSGLRELAEAIEFDHFPGYTADPVVMELKPWQKSELENMEAA